MSPEPDRHPNGSDTQASMTARDALRLLEYVSGTALLTRGQHLKVQAAIRVLDDAIKGAAPEEENIHRKPGMTCAGGTASKEQLP